MSTAANENQRDLITAKEAAEKWGISARRVGKLCSSGRVVGARKKANLWLIPDDLEKPKDNRHARKAVKGQPGKERRLDA